MTPFENILVATDFSEPAEHALQLAVELAKAFDAKLTLLHAYEPPNVYAYTYAVTVPWPTEQLATAAKKSLESALTALKARDIRVESVLQTGTPSDVIISMVKERGCDLVVMGTHGRRGVAHVLFGSVAEKVVRRSPVPVLTVGARGHMDAPRHPTR